MAPLVNNIGLLWVAIEVTTVVSVLLVAIEGLTGLSKQPGGTSCLAPLGSVCHCWRQSSCTTPGATRWAKPTTSPSHKLVGAAAHFPAGTVRLAYLLAVLGFGTKVGFFPVHTWSARRPLRGPYPGVSIVVGRFVGHLFLRHPCAIIK